MLGVGMHDGTIAVYDVRSRQATPVLASTAETGKHADPVWKVSKLFGCWLNVCVPVQRPCNSSACTWSLRAMHVPRVTLPPTGTIPGSQKLPLCGAASRMHVHAPASGLSLDSGMKCSVRTSCVALNDGHK